MSTEEIKKEIERHISEIESLSETLFVLGNIDSTVDGMFNAMEGNEFLHGPCWTHFFISNPGYLILIFEGLRNIISMPHGENRALVLQKLNDELVYTMEVLKARNLPFKN
jgi:hypothetical protein